MKKLFMFFVIPFIAVFMLGGCDLLNDAVDETNQTITVNSSIDTPTSWKSNNVYIIDGTVNVSADLTIEAGTTVRFENDARLVVCYYGDQYAKIIANGTNEKPIRFTSNASSPSSGNWNYVGFYEGSDQSVLSHVIFEYGGKSASNGMVFIENSSVSIDNCLFSHCVGSAIVVQENGFFNSFTNNQFSSVEQHAVEIDANKAHTIGTGNIYSLNSQYGIKISNNFNMSGDYVWKNHGIPYIISENIYIEGSGNGVNLTIDPGTTIKFTQGGGLILSYYSNFVNIIAHGTQQLPITFTSNVPTPQAGNYKGIRFYDGANQCSFKYCTFEYAGSESGYGGIYIEETSVAFENCIFRNIANTVVKLDANASFTSFTNNTFLNNTSNPIEIYSNYVHTIGGGNSFNTTAGIVIKGNFNHEGSFVWKKHDTPYIIADNIYIEAEGNGVVLNIEPGTQIKFNMGTGFKLSYYSSYSKIIAQGTASEPIIFTSSKPSPQRGDWYGIYFYSGSEGSTFNHCQFLYAGKTTSNGTIMLDDTGMNTITISNSRIAYSAGHGITYDNNSSMDISTITFDNNTGNNYHRR